MGCLNEGKVGEPSSGVVALSLIVCSVCSCSVVRLGKKMAFRVW